MNSCQVTHMRAGARSLYFHTFNSNRNWIPAEIFITVRRSNAVFSMICGFLSTVAVNTCNVSEVSQTQILFHNGHILGWSDTGNGFSIYFWTCMTEGKGCIEGFLSLPFSHRFCSCCSWYLGVLTLAPLCPDFCNFFPTNYFHWA